MTVTCPHWFLVLRTLFQLFLLNHALLCIITFLVYFLEIWYCVLFIVAEKPWLWHGDFGHRWWLSRHRHSSDLLWRGEVSCSTVWHLWTCPLYICFPCYFFAIFCCLCQALQCFHLFFRLQVFWTLPLMLTFRAPVELRSLLSQVVTTLLRAILWPCPSTASVLSNQVCS